MSQISHFARYPSTSFLALCHGLQQKENMFLLYLVRVGITCSIFQFHTVFWIPLNPDIPFALKRDPPLSLIKANFQSVPEFLAYLQLFRLWRGDALFRFVPHPKPACIDRLKTFRLTLSHPLHLLRKVAESSWWALLFQALHKLLC